MYAAKMTLNAQLIKERKELVQFTRCSQKWFQLVYPLVVEQRMSASSPVLAAHRQRHTNLKLASHLFRIHRYTILLSATRYAICEWQSNLNKYISKGYDSYQSMQAQSREVLWELMRNLKSKRVLQNTIGQWIRNRMSDIVKTLKEQLSNTNKTLADAMIRVDDHDGVKQSKATSVKWEKRKIARERELIRVSSSIGFMTGVTRFPPKW